MFCTGKCPSYNMYLIAKETPDSLSSFSPWHVDKRMQDALSKRNKQYSHNSLRLTNAALQVLKTVGAVCFSNFLTMHLSGSGVQRKNFVRCEGFVGVATVLNILSAS